MKKVNDNEMILEDYETPLHRQWINTKKNVEGEHSLTYHVQSVLVGLQCKGSHQANSATEPSRIHFYCHFFYLFIISSSLLAALGLRAA